MLIPTGTVHSATVAGATIREVACKHCAGRFFYILRRTGGGRATAPLFIGMTAADEKATAQARANLQAALDVEIDPVPCLYCGWYQPEMIIFAKNRRFALRWGCLGAFGASLLPIIFSILFLDTKGQESAGYFAYGFAFLVLIVFGLKRRAYDPNEGAQTRVGPRAVGQPERFPSLEKAQAALSGAA